MVVALTGLLAEVVEPVRAVIVAAVYMVVLTGLFDEAVVLVRVVIVVAVYMVEVLAELLAAEAVVAVHIA